MVSHKKFLLALQFSGAQLWQQLRKKIGILESLQTCNTSIVNAYKKPIMPHHNFKLPARFHPPNTKKSILDAVDGFHAILLDKESQPLTTFITELGRYMYLRLPQGFLASTDAYTRSYNEIIKPIPHKAKIVDNTLLYDTNIENAFFHV